MGGEVTMLSLGFLLPLGNAHSVIQADKTDVFFNKSSYGNSKIGH